MTETLEAPAALCPHSSIETLNRHMRACRYPKADITALAKRLQEAGAMPEPAAPGQVAALKVEKNALALVFIPAVMDLAEDFVAAHPGHLITLVQGQVGAIPMAEVRAALDPRNPQGALCGFVYVSLRNVFQHAVTVYLQAVAAAAAGGDARMAWVQDTLLARYQAALSGYHAHTAVAATHFTPAGHIMAGVNTALFFILRALSALVVLGERRLGRKLGRDDLAAGIRNTAPLLLTIARCHLELLLELEGPLGKGEDLFLARLDAAGYADALDRMFVVADGADGLRLEVAEGVLAGLPLLSGDKPRTGCPALYASTSDNVNAIVALVRLVERTFADVLFGEAP